MPAQEQLEREQRPQRVTVVARAALVLGEQPVDLSAVEVRCARCAPGPSDRRSLGVEVLAEPAVERHPEAVLASRQDLLRQ